MKQTLIAGNWKMNNGLSETKALIEDLKKIEIQDHCEVVICPPFVNLGMASQLLQGFNIKLGAQNMHYQDKGAYTGEISPKMLKDLNATHVIIGHSERRQYFGETNELTNKKTGAAIGHGLRPILCVGETLAQREGQIAKKIVRRQVIEGLKDIRLQSGEEVVIAYEPVWAIGTGKTATNDEANEMCEFIRQVLSELFGDNIADAIKILYGGSVNPKNVDGLMSEKHIDGALVGGASLKAEDFSRLIHYQVVRP